MLRSPGVEAREKEIAHLHATVPPLAGRQIHDRLEGNVPVTIKLKDGVRDGETSLSELVLRDFNETDALWFILNPTPDLGEVLRQVARMTGERFELLQFLTQDDLLAVLHAFDAQVAKLLKESPAWQS